MASNEEILGHPFYPHECGGMIECVTKQDSLKAMDTARKYEAVEILKFLTGKDSPYTICYGSDTPFATIDDDYTIEQFYTIFKNS